jgi:peptidoglycan/LPS O-acetylase OafA/YrhL
MAGWLLRHSQTGLHPAMKPITGLTSLRGIAALGVVVFHLFPMALGVENLPGVIGRGYLGVDLFFLLSGFVLAHVYGEVFATGVRWIELKSFLWARFARIYPLHFCILLLLLPFYGTNARYSGAALLHNLSLTQGVLLTELTWNVVAWSISIEWQAYLLFPAAVLVLLRCQARTSAAIGVGLAATIAAIALANGNDARFSPGPLLFAFGLSQFLVGILLYRAYRAEWLARLWRSDWTCLVCAATCLALASMPKTDIAVIAALAGLLLACAHSLGRARVLLAARPLQFFGDISYSLYMLHLLTGSFVAGLLSGHGVTGVPALVPMVGVTVGIATLTSRYIEYPLRDLIRGWSGQRSHITSLRSNPSASISGIEN